MVIPRINSLPEIGDQQKTISQITDRALNSLQKILPENEDLLFHHLSQEKLTPEAKNQTDESFVEFDPYQLTNASTKI